MGTERVRARWLSAVAVALVLLWAAAPAYALLIDPLAPPTSLSIPVMHDGKQVGTIDVKVSSDGTGVEGGFTSTVGAPPSVEAAAASSHRIRASMASETSISSGRTHRHE